MNNTYTTDVLSVDEMVFGSGVARLEGGAWTNELPAETPSPKGLLDSSLDSPGATVPLGKAKEDVATVQVLIVSSDPKLRGSLQESFAQINIPGKALFLWRYPAAAELAELIRAKGISSVIISLADVEQALDLIAELRSGYPEIWLVAAHTLNSADLILAAIRAGASEYIGAPFDLVHLEQALRRVSQADSNSAPQGRLVAFLPAHGGCGASTTALNVAAAVYRESSLRTLLLDFDSHTGTTDLRLRLKPNYTVADALQRNGPLDELWDQLACRWNGIEILPPPPEPLLEVQHYSRISAVLVSARRVYGWVITDLPPAIYSSCIDVLRQAQTVYIVCTPEMVPLHLARRKAQALRNLGFSAEAIRLVVNRVNAKAGLDPKEIEQIVNVPVACALRNDYAAVNAASLKGKLVPAESPLGVQYLGLAQQILGVPASERRAERRLSWRRFLPQGLRPPAALQGNR